MSTFVLAAFRACIPTDLPGHSGHNTMRILRNFFRMLAAFVCVGLEGLPV